VKVKAGITAFRIVAMAQLSGVRVLKFQHSNRVAVYYSASHSLVAPVNVGLQKELKYSTFACHTYNEVRLCVLGIRKKEVGNMKR
jgi:hypothetical protein